MSWLRNKKINVLVHTLNLRPDYSKYSKILKNVFLAVLKMFWLSGLKLTKCLSEKQTGNTLIRMLLQIIIASPIYFLSLTIAKVEALISV